ncbi:MAG: L-lactate dehydrogenase [Lachnospiraceae bacterium]
MSIDNRKIFLVGCGMVGMSYAYAMVNQNTCNELILNDLDMERAMGEAMDLNHGLAFSRANMQIRVGGYEECKDADIVVICAGVAQKPGESRLNLLKRNKKVFESVVGNVMKNGFEGIFLIATNPVDIMTRITQEISGMDSKKVFGTGTALDTARLRYELGHYFHVDPKNMHAYVMGEHGDSEFVPWSQALLATKSVKEISARYPEEFSDEEMEKIANEVKTAAYKIIDAKKATYYGIGMALTRITKAIFENENSILTVSAKLNGQYGQHDVYAGVPCVVNRNGVDRIVELDLSEDELVLMGKSCDLLRQMYDGV